MKKIIIARCTDCNAEYGVNPTREEDKDFRPRNGFIPIITCFKCGNDTWKLVIKKKD
nr:MAG: Zn finger protein [uncultured archaeon]